MVAFTREVDAGGSGRSSRPAWGPVSNTIIKRCGKKKTWLLFGHFVICEIKHAVSRSDWMLIGFNLAAACLDPYVPRVCVVLTGPHCRNCLVLFSDFSVHIPVLRSFAVPSLPSSPSLSPVHPFISSPPFFGDRVLTMSAFH